MPATLLYLVGRKEGKKDTISRVLRSGRHQRLRMAISFLSLSLSLVPVNTASTLLHSGSNNPGCVTPRFLASPDAASPWILYHVCGTQ